MLAERRFNIVSVSKNKGVGIDTAKKYDEVVIYNGKKLVVDL
jgi:hypothetical protein